MGCETLGGGGRMNYHRQKIEILIDKDSELYEKLEKRASRDGVTVDSVVDMLLTLGSHGMLERRLEQMDRLRENGSRK